RWPTSATCSSGSAHTRCPGSGSCCPTGGGRYVRGATSRRPDRRHGPGGPRRRGRAWIVAPRRVLAPGRSPEHHPTPADRIEDGVRRTLTFLCAACAALTTRSLIIKRSVAEFLHAAQANPAKRSEPKAHSCG